MHSESYAIVLNVGVLLLAALAAGQLAFWLRLPRVTAYLVTGLLLGPQVWRVVPHEHLDAMEALGDMAMALVLFGMGCHFSLGYFRRILRRALRLSTGEMCLTFTLVAAGMWLVGQSWELSILFGALALATAPATTILVLQENESEGPVTEFTFALVAFNNLAAVIVFEVLFAVVIFFSSDGPMQPHEQLMRLGIDLSTSLLLGAVAGGIVSYVCEVLSPSRWLVLLIGMSTLLLGFCHVTEIPYLLAFLAMGAMVANSSEHAKEVSGTLNGITGLLCVVFFVTHGAELNVFALLAAGSAGIVYIVARSAGKYFGIYFAAGKNTTPEVKRYLGATLLSQAGAAIALCAIASERVPELGKQLEIIILGTVVFFEIAGPLAIRHAVLVAGEVPIDKAIRHTVTSSTIELRRFWNRFLVAIGLDPWHKRTIEDLTIGDLMRKNFDSISDSANFDVLVGVLEHSHDNVFPVLDKEGNLVGLIRYRELRKAVFDPNLGKLVCAADLAQPSRNVVYSDAPVAEAVAMIRQTHDDLLPVLAEPGSERIVGIVARRDLFRFFLKSGS